MKIGQWCLGVIAAVGLGSAAGAATVERYDYLVRYTGTTLFDAEYYEAYDHYDSTPLGNVLAEDYGVAHAFDNLAINDEVEVRIRLFIPTDLSLVPPSGNFSNGGYALWCRIGSFDCAKSVSATFPGLEVWYGDDSTLSKAMNSIRYMVHNFGRAYHSYSEFSGISHRDTEARFEILSELAPVPLPAGAALLPMGLAGFWMVRRRRKQQAA